jgi:hypothetical protein
MSLLGRQDIATLPDVRRVLEHPAVAALLQRASGAPSGTAFHPVRCRSWAPQPVPLRVHVSCIATWLMHGHPPRFL